MTPIRLQPLAHLKVPVVPEQPSALFTRLFGVQPALQQPTPAPAPAEASKTLGPLGLALLCFASIAGGPFGIENSVASIGPLPTMLALLFTAACWSLTQALMAAEMSSMYPCNAGNILWVLKALGPTAGFVNAGLIFLMNVLNLPLYTVLAASCVGQVVALTPGEEFGLQVGVLALGVVVNIMGMAAIEKFTGLLVLLVQVPFLLMPIVWAANRRPFEWRALGSSAPNWLGALGPGLANVCWNSLGWSSVRCWLPGASTPPGLPPLHTPSCTFTFTPPPHTHSLRAQLGNIAGDVKDPTRNIPYGFALAVGMISLNYLLPLLFTIAMSPDIDAWGTGYFVGIAKATSGWLGVLAAVCGVFSSINNLLPQLTMASRQTKATVLARMLPPCLAFLGRDSALTGTPVAAILLIAGCSLCLLRLDFDVLVVLEVLCALVALLLQFAAFLVLKHRQPNAPRPFAVPGGLCGAYAISIPFFLLATMLIYFDTVGNFVALSVGALCLLFLLLGRFWYADQYTPEVLELLLRDEGDLDAGVRQARAAMERTLPLETVALLSTTGGL